MRFVSYVIKENLPYPILTKGMVALMGYWCNFMNYLMQTRFHLQLIWLEADWPNSL
jgi:hypothetical protein